MKQHETKWTEWMVAGNGGNAAAYEQLLRDLAAALRPAVQRGLARANRPAADAEDIVQEILIAVHMKRHTWDETRPLGPWLGAIARYKLIDALRRRGSRHDVPIEDFLETLAAEPAAPPMQERDMNVQLECLSPGQRSVVSAIALDGASVGEAAERLHMSQGAVRVTLHRALKQLARNAD